MTAGRAGSTRRSLRAGQTAGRARPALRRGFTLLEVLLALSLFVLLAAMAWPLMQGQLVAAELPESASRLRSLLYMTRSSAMLEHRRHRVRFSPGEQQPVIEVEPDPIIEPGLWVPAYYDWAEEPALLADIEVHRVLPGRPAYMRPVSVSEEGVVDPLEAEPVAEEETSAVESTSAKLQAARSDGMGGQEIEIDELRPIILFEADGSAEWATLVLSRIAPTEELPEEEPQSWVVLDGRTGLATIRDAVTQKQLNDPTFYVQREKLEIPDVTAPEDMTLTIPADGTGQKGADDSSQAAVDPSSGQQEIGNLPPIDPTALQQGQPPQDAAADPNAPQSADDALAQLEKELADSNLSDEEKEEIRRAFQEAQPKQSDTDGKSPS
ncbi:MAG TPA: prepilin-type N-terminal cleavage/methylation domain-containing protein [Phycisphaerae bacterium]|nr:prepilin-type N-terminal cleavage/methylation domain-containing protein [Phycisphaerae bacterium]